MSILITFLTAETKYLARSNAIWRQEDVISAPSLQDDSPPWQGVHNAYFQRRKLLEKQQHEQASKV